MTVKQSYLQAAVDSILQIDPSFNREQLEDMVKSRIRERMRDPSIVIDNNVTGVREQTNLTNVCNWITKTNPVISGNATFYMQPEVLQSPTSKMLRTLKKQRKDIKKEMFKYKPEDDMYQLLDLGQLNAKVIMNAEYGASGAPMAAFYTKYSPAATTLMAQSIITTMAAFFEGYVGDNMKFFHINECIDWMNCVRRKDKKIPKWIRPAIHSETSRRIRDHFFQFDIEDGSIIDSYLNNCTQDELTYIFYANNLKEFIARNNNVKKIINDILRILPLYEASIKDIPVEYQDKFDNVNKYNGWVSEQMFLNPYNIPETIRSEMKELTSLLNQFVFVEYLTSDSIAKLNNHKRNTILLVDTDSNVINADIFVKFVLDEMFPVDTFARNKLYNEMICVNILASVLDDAVVKILDLYGRVHNMGEDARKELVMKNEFMFRRFFLMTKKKRYASSIALREGHIMMPFKTEIKGMDFIKAGVTEEVTERFTKMLEDHILFSEELELHELMRELKRFESEIYRDLKQGGIRFLKPQSYKSESAYKTSIVDGVKVSRAWQLPVFRGVAVWNEIYPKQKIYSLDRVKIVKLIVTSIEDLDVIKNKYPKEYDVVMKKIFRSNNPVFVQGMSKDVPQPYDEDKQSKNNKTTMFLLKVIAIPSNVKEIPEWLIPLIDYDVIISDVIGSFRSILEALRIEEVNLKTPHGKANITSSLISI